MWEVGAAVRLVPELESRVFDTYFQDSQLPIPCSQLTIILLAQESETCNSNGCSSVTLDSVTDSLFSNCFYVRTVDSTRPSNPDSEIKPKIRPTQMLTLQRIGKDHATRDRCTSSPLLCDCDDHLYFVCRFDTEACEDEYIIRY